MRVGFDIDGVLADFVPAYQDLFIQLTGRNTFGAGDRRDPPEWNWPTLRGYTAAETSAAWGEIKKSSTFWLNLSEDRGCPTLRGMVPELERNHEVYFLTTRVGLRPKRQTEIWLWDHLGYSRLAMVWPTVGVAAHRQKGHLVKGLALDAFIDDNLDNVNDIAWGTTPTKQPEPKPTCRVYLLNRAYNQNVLQCEAGVLNPNVVRVDTIGEMFDAEIKLGTL